MNAGRFPQSQSRVRVRYAETDKMGVVYYANYFVWFEVGRTDLLRDAGWSYREMESQGYALPVTSALMKTGSGPVRADGMGVHGGRARRGRLNRSRVSRDQLNARLRT